MKNTFKICKALVSSIRIMDTKHNNTTHPTERTAPSAPAGPPIAGPLAALAAEGLVRKNAKIFKKHFHFF